MNLHEIRKERGLTLLEIEAMTGIKNSHLSMIENYKAGLTDRVAAKLAPVLKVDKQALIEDQAAAAFKHQAAALEALTPETLKSAAGKNTKKAAAAVAALVELVGDENLPLDMRQQAEKSANKLLNLLPGAEAGSKKSKAQGAPERDFYGRKRPGRKTARDPLGRARAASKAINENL